MYADYGYGSYQSSTDQNGGSKDSSSYGSYESYYGQYENNWVDGSATIVPDTTGVSDIGGASTKKEGARNELPTEIFEVEQCMS
ncbi:hypothetical protein SLEP1_g30512 [Rubroshorea leprosula]|uniref:Uncharacterized protein n=1 Tax=Rubroshorea leprosula TaxID=152421 RepID=A0AAV5K5Y2_9ROSI|nr:hypothetical protein SLEP1_g30512 [Rubroshorea leprosula]